MTTVPDHTGFYTGLKTKSGRMIRCGDRVEFTEIHEAYTSRTMEDGWGRTIHLSRGDWTEVPEMKLTSQGVVFYDPGKGAYRVKLDTSHATQFPITGWRREDFLYMFIHYKTFRVL